MNPHSYRLKGRDFVHQGKIEIDVNERAVFIRTQGCFFVYINSDCFLNSLMRVEQMEQIINYRDIPTDKRIDILNALERIGFFPAYGGVRTMQQIMEKSVPGSGPQFYFVFRENELIGYNFLIGDTKKYKAFPWLAISNMDEQKLTVCEELMKMQIAFFEELGMQKIADHCVRIMEDYRKEIGKRKESDCR